MRSREILVSELINNPLAPPLVIEELQSYGHACEKALARVTRVHIFSILEMFAQGTLSPEQVETGAGRLEDRHDLEFEFGDEGAVREVLLQLDRPFRAEPAKRR